MNDNALSATTFGLRITRLAISGLLLATAVFATAAQAQQRLLPQQSEVSFTSRQMGVPVDGKFTRFAAPVMDFNPKNPAASKMTLTVDLASVAIGTKETEAELAKPGWFDTSKFPQATFTASSVKALGGNRFEVAGNLAIKGASRPMSLPVTLTQAGDVTTASGSFLLKRLDFKIGDGEWNDPSLVANDVVVRVRFALSGVPKL
jgi:polyisoprenoid-binding protein YceI